MTPTPFERIMGMERPVMLPTMYPIIEMAVDGDDVVVMTEAGETYRIDIESGVIKGN